MTDKKWYFYKFSIKLWQITDDGRLKALGSSVEFNTIGTDWQEAVERARAFHGVPIEIQDGSRVVELQAMYGCEHYPIAPEPEKRKIQVDE